MDIMGLLKQKPEEILGEAVQKMARSHLKHYEMMGSERASELLKTLYSTLLECLEKKSTIPMLRYAEKIGDERFSSGFALGEVQTAFNVLEESIWEQIWQQMKPEEYADAVQSISEALRMGKEAVARVYFSGVATIPSWG